MLWEQYLEHVQLRHEVQILQEIHTIQHEVQQHVLLEITMVQERQLVQLEQPHNLRGQYGQVQERQALPQEQQSQLTPDQHQDQVVL